MTEPIHILSLGAGVQSSTLALMAAHGEITPMPKCAIFADTGDEPQSVYVWLHKLSKQLPFEVRVRRSMKGSLSGHVLAQIKAGERVSKPPLYVLNEDGTSGILTRDCTGDFKVAVIQREVRKVMRETGATKVIQWIGISVDEVHRMKPSRVQYSTHRWPLIEKRISRNDCLIWIAGAGYDRPPRSACVYCPYHSDNEWRRLRDQEPEAWNRAIKFDKAIRTGIHKVRGTCFVHNSCVPLDEVDLRTDEDHGQQVMFGSECEGLCNV
jgi:hypothetical protein